MWRFFKLLIKSNTGRGALLVRLLVFLLSLSYLFYQLLSGASLQRFYTLFFLVLLLSLLPFYQLSVWWPVAKYRNFIVQLYSDMEVWGGIQLFTNILSILIALLLYACLAFLGFDLLWGVDVFVLVLLSVLALNSVIQFVFSISTRFSEQNSVWLFVLTIPLVIPVVLSGRSSWVKYSLNFEQDMPSDFNIEDSWLLGMWLLFSAVSYLLFEKTWKS